MKKGFITLDRSILDFEWFTDPETLHVYIYLMLIANASGRLQHKNGYVIPPGCLLTSYHAISEDTGLNDWKIHHAFKNLESSNNINIETVGDDVVIEVKSFRYWQSSYRTDSKGKKTSYIKIDRSIINWKWFADNPTFTFYLFSIIRANFKEGVFKGRIIERGSFAASRKNICHATGLSEKQVRLATEKLRKSSDLKIDRHKDFMIYSVENYEKWQTNEAE